MSIINSSIKALVECIKELCEEQNITVNALAKRAGLTQSTVDSILKGKSQNPTFTTLRKLSAGFQIEYDQFILRIRSKEDELSPFIEDKFDKGNIPSTISKRLKSIRNERKISLRKIVEETGLRLGFQDASAYEYGHIEDLVKLADYFDVSIDYLVGRSDVPERR